MRETPGEGARESKDFSIEQVMSGAIGFNKFFNRFIGRTMSPDDIIRAEIRPGEQILWSGRPRQGIVVHLVDSWSFVGGTFLAAMAGMTALQPEVSNRWVGILLLGPIALYAVVGRFVIDAWQRSRTHYGITSDRILIVVDFPNHRVQSLFYNAIANVSIVSDRSGRGR